MSFVRRDSPRRMRAIDQAYAKQQIDQLLRGTYAEIYRSSIKDKDNAPGLSIVQELIIHWEAVEKEVKEARSEPQHILTGVPK